MNARNRARVSGPEFGIEGLPEEVDGKLFRNMTNATQLGNRVVLAIVYNRFNVGFHNLLPFRALKSALDDVFSRAENIQRPNIANCQAAVILAAAV